MVQVGISPWGVSADGYPCVGDQPDLRNRERDQLKHRDGRKHHRTHAWVSPGRTIWCVLGRKPRLGRHGLPNARRDRRKHQARSNGPSMSVAKGTSCCPMELMCGSLIRTMTPWPRSTPTRAQLKNLSRSGATRGGCFRMGPDVWVTNVESNSVTLINAITGEVEGTVAGEFAAPSAVFADGTRCLANDGPRIGYLV